MAGLLGGGTGLRIIDYLIAWSRERREQHIQQAAHEKDRPRFRIDVSVVPTHHAAVPAAIVEILSLGSLPITINQGEVFIEANHYPERVQSYQIEKTEISPIHPIKFQFPLPQKLVNPSGVGKPIIKLVTRFSYGKHDDKYEDEKIYTHRMPQTFE